MRSKLCYRCLDILAKIVVTGNIGGISYVEEAFRQEIERNDMKKKMIALSRKLKGGRRKNE